MHSVAANSKEDMQELLQDPAYFDAFVDSLTSTKQRDRQLEDALRRNTFATGSASCLNLTSTDRIVRLQSSRSEYATAARA